MDDWGFGKCLWGFVNESLLKRSLSSSMIPLFPSASNKKVFSDGQSFLHGISHMRFRSRISSWLIIWSTWWLMVHSVNQYEVFIFMQRQYMSICNSY